MAAPMGEDRARYEGAEDHAVTTQRRSRPRWRSRPWPMARRLPRSPEARRAPESGHGMAPTVAGSCRRHPKFDTLIPHFAILDWLLREDFVVNITGSHSGQDGTTGRSPLSVEPLSPCSTGLPSSIAMPSAKAVRCTRCAAWWESSVACTSQPTILRLYRSRITCRSTKRMLVFTSHRYLGGYELFHSFS